MIITQFQTALEYSGKRRVARLSAVKDNLGFALEDAYDIFSEDSESNQKIQTLKTAYKLFTNEQYKVQT